MRESFERDGFLVLPGFVEPGACDALIARADVILGASSPTTVSIFTTNEQARHSDAYFLESGDKIRCFYEEDAWDDRGELRYPVQRSINKIGHALHDLDPIFDAFSRQPALAKLASDIGMRDAVLLQSMYIFKQPFIGGEVTAHQDHTFLWTEPQSVTGFWFALEDATIENGCMWATPGSHREPARKRFRREGTGTTFDVLDERPLAVDAEVPLVAPKGTCIVLHGQLVHRSGANRSPASRQAYSLHCIERSAHYPADNWLQGAAMRGFR
jgi:phytanoyl-CoA hydroxylase